MWCARAMVETRGGRAQFGEEKNEENEDRAEAIPGYIGS